MKESFFISQYFFLKGMALIYLFAFVSLFVQISGLYGADGVLPYSSYANAIEKRFGSNSYQIVPSLLWFSDFLKPVFDYFPELSSMDKYENSGFVICLVGTFLSLGIIWERKTHYFTNSIVFATLWVLYFSVYTFGQTFFTFQWDIFLLETGFLIIFFVPAQKEGKVYHDNMSVAVRILLQWLAFRFFFSSGVVKLLSGCQTWWSLTALNYHFESQCIPHMLSWHAHHMPEILKKSLVVITYITLIFGSMLMYIPIKQIRHIGAFMQFCMQISIIFTGNYNFFNFHSLIMLLPFINDDVILKFTPKLIRSLFARDIEAWSFAEDNKKSKLLSECIQSCLFGIFAIGVAFFRICPPDYFEKGSLNFSKEQLLNFAKATIEFAGLITMIYVLIDLIAFGVKFSKQSGSKMFQYLKRGFALCFASYIIIASLYPTSFNIGYDIDIPMLKNYSRTFYKNIDRFHIVNSYGLFRAMTGVDGREELVIEGSYDRKTWKEYEFPYKPGNITLTPKFCIPHQPRLDWQIWFAALRPRIHTEEWLINLFHKLFEGSPSVLSLLSVNPFAERPPEFLRIIKYIYAFTTPEEKEKTGNYWKRSFKQIYTGIIHRKDPVLKDYLNRVSVDLVQVHNGKYPINPFQRIPLFNIVVSVIVAIILKNYFIDLFKETKIASS